MQELKRRALALAVLLNGGDRCRWCRRPRLDVESLALTGCDFCCESGRMAVLLREAQP